MFALNEKALARVRRRALVPARAMSLAATFRVLGNPTRVRILDALGYSELCVCDLAALLGARISAVSHQLALLKAHRLVRSRRKGKMIFYALDDPYVRAVVAQGLAHAEHAALEPEQTTGSARAERLRSSRRGTP